MLIYNRTVVDEPNLTHQLDVQMLFPPIQHFWVLVFDLAENLFKGHAG